MRSGAFKPGYRTLILGNRSCRQWLQNVQRRKSRISDRSSFRVGTMPANQDGTFQAGVHGKASELFSSAKKSIVAGGAEFYDPTITHRALSFLANYDEEKPFFIQLGYINPHDICKTNTFSRIRI